MKNLSLMVFLSILLTGCMKEPEIVFDKPEVQMVKEEKQVIRNKGSLYSNTGTSLFADKKDLQVGDIIQVVIGEKLTANSKDTRATSKTNDTSQGGGILSPLTGVTNTAGTADRINRLNNVLGVGFESSSANAFSGSANSKLDEKFETTLSVIIEETYQNGNYYVKGSKEMLIDGQKQDIIISGVIRPYDISPENSILSSQIANLKIAYKKEGEEADSLKKSWGTRIIEKIWPF